MLSLINKYTPPTSGVENHGVVTNVLDGDIVVNEFEFQSHYYKHLRSNTLGKDKKPLVPNT